MRVLHAILSWEKCQRKEGGKDITAKGKKGSDIFSFLRWTTAGSLLSWVFLLHVAAPVTRDCAGDLTLVLPSRSHSSFHSACSFLGANGETCFSFPVWLKRRQPLLFVLICGKDLRRWQHRGAEMVLLSLVFSIASGSVFSAVLFLRGLPDQFV